MHHCLTVLNPRFVLPIKVVRVIGWSMLSLLSALLLFNGTNWYTGSAGLLAWILLLVALVRTPDLLSRYLVSYMLILIPFIIVNGILTGSHISDQVVWYNDDENLGIRFLTIPVEDFIYCFSMILLPLLTARGLRNVLKNRG